MLAAPILGRSRADAQSSPPSPPTNLQVGAASGFPGPTNTGPASGSLVQNYTGLYEVHGDGLVVSGLRVTGAILVYGNNVTVQNCDVNASGELWAIRQQSGTGLKVKNCRLYGIPSPSNRAGTHVLTAVDGAVEVAYCNIHGVENAIQSGTDYIHDNYIHDFARWIAADDHTDGIQTYGSSGAGGLKVIHNTIIAILTGGDYTPINYGAGSSAVALSEGMHDLTIANNLFAGGTYTLYGPSQAGSSPSNVIVTNNRFSTQYYPRCGMYGTHTGFKLTAPGFQWAGNVWHETGQPLAF